MFHYFIFLLRKIQLTEWKTSKIMKDNFIMYSGNVCRVLFQETRNINFPDRTTYLKWCMLMPSMKSRYVLYIVLISLGFLLIYWIRISSFFLKKIKEGFFFCVWLLEKFSFTERLDKNFIFNVKMTLWL